MGPCITPISLYNLVTLYIFHIFLISCRCISFPKPRITVTSEVLLPSHWDALWSTLEVSPTRRTRNQNEQVESTHNNSGKLLLIYDLLLYVFFQCLCFFVDDVDVLSFCIWRFEKTCSCFWCENYWRCCRGFSPPTRSTGWPCGRLHLGHPKWCLSFFFLIVPLEFKQKIQLESPKWSGKVCIN